MNSPEYIQTSLAAAISLGMTRGRFKEKVSLTGLNLLLVYDEGCIGRCAYCGLSGQRGHPDDPTKKSKTFIRVKWPVFMLDEVIQKTKENKDKFERICISMVTHRDALKDTVLITKKIKKELPHPISILLTPTLIRNKKDLEDLKNAGADMAGIAIDAATEDLFIKYRGSGVKGPHRWQKYWEVLKLSAEVFGDFKSGIHLICGLGETDLDIVKAIFKAHEMKAKTHLFSFFPEACSALEDHLPPQLLKYRKIQIARYLINEKNLNPEKIAFDNSGSIMSFDYDLEEIISEGYAFMTSGCPGKDEKIAACNRPLANERPSEDFRNYPYVPGEIEKQVIRSQIKSILDSKK